MPTIGGEGGIRRTLIPGQGLAADVAARASELALRLAVSLERSHGWEAQETARLLDEVRRLPAAAQEAFLAAAAGAPRGGPKEWGERIARACPEGSERELGTVTRALETLGRVAAPARPVSVDTLERARSFGPFGSPTPPVPPSLTGVSLVSAATASGEGLLEGLSATWRTTLARVQETAPGLVGGIAPIGRAEGAVAAVREGLARIGAGEGFWARARRAASEDALGRVASRFEVLRDRVNGGLEAAGTIPDRARGGMANGQWAMGNGQWAMGNGQWANTGAVRNSQ